MSSLYIGSASVLKEFLQNKSPLTELIYSTNHLPPKQRKAAYAITLGALRYKHILESVIDMSGVMKIDRKMNPGLVLVMVYDLLFGSSQSIEGGGGVKKILISQENKLRTALARIKVQHGVRDDEDLLPKEIRFAAQLPRYARVNTLRSTVESVKSILAAEGFQFQNHPFVHQSVTWSTDSIRHFYADAHIPNLLVFHPGTDLHDHTLIHSGQLILQDKASCMTAAALDPKPIIQASNKKNQPMPYHMIDACAAPGNKTTHLLAVATEHFRNQYSDATIQLDQPAANAQSTSTTPNTAQQQPLSHKISRHSRPSGRSTSSTTDDDENDSFTLTGSNRATGESVSFTVGASTSMPMLQLDACEVDPTRFQLLQKMMRRALPTHTVTHGQLAKSAVLPEPITTSALPPSAPCRVTLRNQSFLDLSPNAPEFASVKAILLDPTCSGSGMGHRIEQFYKHRVVDMSGNLTNKKQHSGFTSLATRLLPSGQEKPEVMENVAKLAEFQKQILHHALSFPNVDLVAYSTCSTHAAEDEGVVEHVLSLHPEFGLSSALPRWPRRGLTGDTELKQSQANCLVRSAGAEDGMNGFFVAKFVRKGTTLNQQLNSQLRTKSTLSSTKRDVNVGQKRSRQTEGESNHSEPTTNIQPSSSNPVPTPSSSSSSSSSSIGKQTLRNKRKREKAKLKKQKLTDTTAQTTKEDEDEPESDTD